VQESGFLVWKRMLTLGARHLLHCNLDSCMKSDTVIAPLRSWSWRRALQSSQRLSHLWCSLWCWRSALLAGCLPLSGLMLWFCWSTTECQGCAAASPVPEVAPSSSSRSWGFGPPADGGLRVMKTTCPAQADSAFINAASDKSFGPCTWLPFPPFSSHTHERFELICRCACHAWQLNGLSAHGESSAQCTSSSKARQGRIMLWHTVRCLRVRKGNITDTMRNRAIPILLPIWLRVPGRPFWHVVLSSDQNHQERRFA